MKLQLMKEKIEFDFPKASELLNFDNDDRNSPDYHGLSHCMKAVDVVSQFEKYQLWIEVKEFPQAKVEAFHADPDKKGSKHDKSLSDYLNDVKLKFRDTYLYRRCEKKNDLPVVFVFLTNFPDDLCNICQSRLVSAFPAGRAVTRWQMELVHQDWVFVVNFETWKKKLATVFGQCNKL